MVILVIWMLYNMMYSVRKSAQFYTDTLSCIACILGSRLYISTCIISILVYAFILVIFLYWLLLAEFCSMPYHYINATSEKCDYKLF